MGQLFSHPEILAPVIAAVGGTVGAVAALLKAWKGNRPFGMDPPDDADDALRSEINRLNSMITDLQKRANSDEDSYKKIRRHVNNKNYKIGLSKNKVAIIGPKGAGKTMFLWTKGLADRPENEAGDGTTELNLMANSNYVDTIGVDFQYHQMMKMIATFVVLNHFPDTLILCCNAHQVNQAINLMALIGVSKYYVVIMNNTKALEDKTSKDAFNHSVYAKVEQLNPSAICVSQDTEIDEGLDSFGEMAKVFKKHKVKLEDFQTNKSPRAGVVELTRFMICKYIFELETVWENDALAFLNDINM